MTNPPSATSHFSAAQLALAMGTSRTRAHQVLARASQAAITLPVRGQATKHWPLDAMPADVQAMLRRKAQAGKYCSWTHLLFDPPQPWQPKVPLARLARSGIDKAELRRAVLAPILVFGDAMIVPVSELVRRAQTVFQDMIEIRQPQDLAVRQWIERAIDRDRGLGQWQRTELYLDENPPVQTAARRVATVLEEAGGDPLARALFAVVDAAAPTAPECNHVWNVTFHRFGAMVAGGATPGKAKRALVDQLEASGVVLLVGTSAARSMAWKRQYLKWQEGGACADAFVDLRTVSNGRRTSLGSTATEADKANLRRLTLKTGSEAMALEMYAEMAECSPELRADICRPRKSRHNVARSLRRLAHVTPEQVAKELGGRAYQYQAFTTRRGDFEIMEDGSKRAIEAGDWWELDDMSWNQPFWWESLADDDVLATRFGVCMARQSLMAQDLKSGKWLGAELIGRSRDSYRAEDILRFFHRLFALYGMPRRGVRLERGIWKSRVINGRKVQGLSKEEEEKVFGGLRQFGIRVEHCWTAKQKGLIETGFGYLQKAAAAIIPGPNVGRWRGERADDSKKVQRALSGIVHPREIGCLHIDEMQGYVGKTLVWCNSRVKEGSIQRGVPDEVWAQSLERLPLRPLPPDLLYVLLPEQRELTIRAGHIWPKVDGDEIQFSAPELFARLGTGYRVIACFDATDTSLGAWVFSAQAPSEYRAGHAVGTYLGHAEFCPRSPQIAAAGFLDGNIDRRKKYHRAFRVAFIAPGTFGHKGAITSELRDGQGNVFRREEGNARIVEPAGGRRRRATANKGDELIAQAKSMAAAKTAKKPGPDLEEMKLNNRIRHLEMVEDHKLAPYFLTPEEQAELQKLRLSLRTYKKGRGEVDLVDLARRRNAAKRELGIFDT